MVSPPPGGGGCSQGKARVSWVKARVSAREPEISPKRPRCLLEVRHTITPRCGPGLAAGGLWGRPAGARVWVGARGQLLAGLRGCRTLQGPWGSRPASHGASCKLQTQGRTAWFQAFSMTSGKKRGPRDSRCGRVGYPSLGDGGRKGPSSPLPVAGAAPLTGRLAVTSQGPPVLRPEVSFWVTSGGSPPSG